MGKIAYIAGSNGGGKGYERLKKAEKYLTEKGYTVTSMHGYLVEGIGREEYARKAIEYIVGADVVYFLEGWRNSDTAQFDRSVCTFFEKNVRNFYE